MMIIPLLSILATLRVTYGQNVKWIVRTEAGSEHDDEKENDVPCPSGYIGVGLCASGKRRDCKHLNDEWMLQMMFCKKLEGVAPSPVDNAHTTRDWGGYLECDANTVATKTCTTNNERWCYCDKGQHGSICPNNEWSNTVLYCSRTNKSWSKSSIITVLGPNHGDRLQCPYGYGMVGICSSGAGKECKHKDIGGKDLELSHYIKCAKLIEGPDHYYPKPKNYRAWRAGKRFWIVNKGSGLALTVIANKNGGMAYMDIPSLDNKGQQFSFEGHNDGYQGKLWSGRLNNNIREGNNKYGQGVWLDKSKFKPYVRQHKNGDVWHYFGHGILYYKRSGGNWQYMVPESGAGWKVNDKVETIPVGSELPGMEKVEKTAVAKEEYHKLWDIVYEEEIDPTNPQGMWFSFTQKNKAITINNYGGGNYRRLLMRNFYSEDNQLFRFDDRQRLISKPGLYATRVEDDKVEAGKEIFTRIPIYGKSETREQWMYVDKQVASLMTHDKKDEKKDWVMTTVGDKLKFHKLIGDYGSYNQNFTMVPLTMNEDYKEWMDDVNPLSSALFYHKLITTHLFELTGMSVYTMAYRMSMLVGILDDTAKSMEKKKTGTGIMQIIGGGLSIIGSVMTLAGLFLAPVTGGLSLGLTLGGTALGLAGGAMTTGAYIKNTKDEEGAQEIVNVATHSIFTAVSIMQSLFEEYAHQMNKIPAHLRTTKGTNMAYAAYDFELFKIDHCEMLVSGFVSTATFTPQAFEKSSKVLNKLAVGVTNTYVNGCNKGVLKADRGECLRPYTAEHTVEMENCKATFEAKVGFDALIQIYDFGRNLRGAYYSSEAMKQLINVADVGFYGRKVYEGGKVVGVAKSLHSVSAISRAFAINAAAPGFSMAKFSVQAGSNTAKAMAGALAGIGLLFGIWDVWSGADTIKNNGDFGVKMKEQSKSLLENGRRLIRMYMQLKQPMNGHPVPRTPKAPTPSPTPNPSPKPTNEPTNPPTEKKLNPCNVPAPDTEEIFNCGEYDGSGCKGKGLGCVGEGWFSKINRNGKYAKVNAEDICKSYGYAGVDQNMYGYNWWNICRFPGNANRYTANKGADKLTNLGYGATWKCTGDKVCNPAVPCKTLPTPVQDCSKYTGTKECTGKGAGCVGEGWFSKDNQLNPLQRVNAQQVCKDQGYIGGADTQLWGGNWGHQCRFPGNSINTLNKAGGPLTSLGSTVAWKCKGQKACYVKRDPTPRPTSPPTKPPVPTPSPTSPPTPSPSNAPTNPQPFENLAKMKAFCKSHPVYASSRTNCKKCFGRFRKKFVNKKKVKTCTPRNTKRLRCKAMDTYLCGRVPGCNVQGVKCTGKVSRRWRGVR